MKYSTLCLKNMDTFLVCGLGSLGQNCVIALKEFGVKVIAIEQEIPAKWEIAKIPELLDDLIVGDCRSIDILIKARIQQCRAILIVTSDEEVNAETAITSREINSCIRIIMRSCQENLNKLLRDQLGNFFADEPAHLTASAFALSGLSNEMIGFFKINSQRLQVIIRQLKPSDTWVNMRKLWEINNQKRRLIAHYSLSVPLTCNFHQWYSETVLRSGDTIVYVEVVEEFSLNRSSRWNKLPRLVNFWQSLRREITQFGRFKFLRQIRSIAIVSAILIALLLLIGTILFNSFYQDTNILYAFYATAVLLLGGYADLFGQLEPVTKIPGWLQLFALSLTIIGTIFVGILYALITENLLSSKFELVLNRPPIPNQEHIILVGLGKVGQRVAKVLQEFKESLVAIDFNTDFDRTNLPNIPLVIGNLSEALEKANFAKAKSVIITTDNEMLNLEIALTTRNLNPESHLVIGTYKSTVSYQLTRLLSHTQVIGTYTVAAEAFAGAAFGENIISLFRHNNQTILITEYQIEGIDTLNGLLISEINYGYHVMVILYQNPRESPIYLPSEDLRVTPGDRLVVLATVESLQRIERGEIEILERYWQVYLEKALTPDSLFEAANTINRVTGYHLASARDLVKNLPQTLPLPLYRQQAERLVRELKKTLVKAYLINQS